MATIKSLEDLKNVQKEILERRKKNAAAGKTQVLVGMGSCGIAVGALETLSALQNQIKSEKLNDITLVKTGCIGLCEREPIVQVVIGEETKVTYGKVTPEVARRIVHEHIAGGRAVADYVIEV